ncbi:ATP-binding cassette domain-containing protein [Marinobacter zhanjiangensis]|uniref:Iron-hydroxamate transporter ATP-binding protein n=1 Tax=Marinobacter zhanjiangensis TaxID=578215 RepID=A0ABQ3B1R3_9GAMM|nr:ATP-binding cassette domain-containing protein [Marinobacter zhanjiangensis]GGY73890.1 iron-hydroxamate transporter ATP-binding protein [Marinobacter zhanjiangensis]
MFRLDAVSYRLPAKTLLHPIDLTIDHGQVVGLIGHNGSGKSTLLKLLARQLTPSAGRIILEDKDLHRWGDRPLARQIAYLPQQPPATDGLTAMELISFGRYPWHGALGRFSWEDQQQVEKAMALTDTEAFANRGVDELSGGERQRVWLAMLLAQNARFLLLDEPTSALDVAHQVEVLSLVRKLGKELNMGVVVVLHDINMAAAYCDHLVALHSGRLLTEGAPEQLMNRDTLEDIYGIPMSILPHPHNHGGRIAVV